MFAAMPPKKATAAQKGKAGIAGTSQAQRVTRARVYDLPEVVPPGKKAFVREIHQLASLGDRLADSGDSVISVRAVAESSIIEEIKQRQFEDPILVKYRDVALNKEKTLFEISPEGILLYEGRFCVPDVAGLRRQIMGEAHNARYSVHPGSTKMYHDLRSLYWWDGMKKDIAEFVGQCPNCQQVKIEHQKRGGLLQEMEIPAWK